MRTLELLRFDEVNDAERPSGVLGALAALRPAPRKFGTAQAVRNATGGFGIFDAGWHFNVATGNVAAAFGGVLATAVGSNTYRNPGPRGQFDYSVGFDSIADGFTGGDNFDILTGDLFVLAVVKASVQTNGDICGKGYPTSGFVFVLESTGQLKIYLHDGTNNPSAGTATTWPLEKWAAIAGIVDQGTEQLRAGFRTLDNTVASVSSEVNISAVTSLSTATNFRIGDNSVYRAHTGLLMEQLYIGTRPGSAAGASASLATILQSFVDSLNSDPIVVDAAAGRGRSFVALSGHGYDTSDEIAGTTLATRDATVQALLAWNLAGQASAAMWKLTKAGGTGGVYDAGASSVQSIAGDGALFFSAASPQGDVVFGFNASDASQDYTDIDYGLFLQAGPGSMQVFEQGNLRFTDTYAFGDSFEIRRTGTVVTYYRNNVLQYTSGVASSGALFVDSALSSVGAVIERIFLVDAGVRVAITWRNIVSVAIESSGHIGTLYARGKATDATEYLSAGVELRVVNASQNVGELAWLWQTSAGTLKRQVGGHFKPPTSGYALLTVTRRWESPTKVVLRYYIADVLLAEVESIDGDIGGSTSGTTTIGYRFDGLINVDFLDGVIDELRVCDYEMSREEIEATWKRISYWQPDGYRAIRDLMPPDIPISEDPTSRVQKDLNTMGQALGYAAAQVENVRDNIMPDRAYGEVQSRWEGIAQQYPQLLDSLDRRRSRVLGHLGKRKGVSVPGVQEAEAELLDLDESQIEVLAFDNTIYDRWVAIERERWLGNGPAALVTKTGGGAAWNAGASISTQLIADGAAVVVCQLPAANERRIIGLTEATPVHTDAGIKWGLYFGRTANDSVSVYQSGAAGFAETTYVTGDIFEVRRRGSTIEYRKNGTVFYTSLVPSLLPVWMDVSIFDTIGVAGLSALRDFCGEIEMVFDRKTNASTTSAQIEAYGARLMKTAASASWDAGAASVESFGGDGYVEAIADITTTERAFGLSYVDTNVNYTSIDYAVILLAAASELRIYELGVQKLSSTYAAGDVLRIERSGAVIAYRKNGAVIYTSATPAIGALIVDSSFTTQNAVVDAIRLYDAGVRVPITWSGVVGVRADGDSLRYQCPANNLPFDNDTYDGLRSMMTVDEPRSIVTGSNPTHGLTCFLAVDPVLLPANSEAGVFLWDYAGRNIFFFGLRYTGAAYQVGYQRYRADQDSVDATWQVLATTSLTKHWLRIGLFSGSAVLDQNEQQYDLSWSTTGNQESQLTTLGGGIKWWRYVGWWGTYIRTQGATGSPLDIRFSETQFRNHYGKRPFYWYAVRDPRLSGAYDLLGANAVARRLRHANTHAAVITRRSFLCDDVESLCDVGPLGGI